MDSSEIDHRDEPINLVLGSGQDFRITTGGKPQSLKVAEVLSPDCSLAIHQSAEATSAAATCGHALSSNRTPHYLSDVGFGIDANYYLRQILAYLG